MYCWFIIKLINLLYKTIFCFKLFPSNSFQYEKPALFPVAVIENIKFKNSTHSWLLHIKIPFLSDARIKYHTYLIICLVAILNYSESEIIIITFMLNSTKIICTIYILINTNGKTIMTQSFLIF